MRHHEQFHGGGVSKATDELGGVRAETETSVHIPGNDNVFNPVWLVDNSHGLH